MQRSSSSGLPFLAVGSRKAVLLPSRLCRLHRSLIDLCNEKFVTHLVHSVDNQRHLLGRPSPLVGMQWRRRRGSSSWKQVLP